MQKKTVYCICMGNDPPSAVTDTITCDGSKKEKKTKYRNTTKKHKQLKIRDKQNLRMDSQTDK